MNSRDENNDVTMSIGKYLWWLRPTMVGSMAMPRIGVLLGFLSRLHRPGCPTESMLAGYVKQMKFAAGEQDLLVDTLLLFDAAFFEHYLTRGMLPLSRVGQKRACAEATGAFLRRSPVHLEAESPAITPGPIYDDIMEAAVTRAQAQAKVRPEPEANCTGRIR